MAEPIRDVPIKDIRDVAKTGLNVRRTDRDAKVEDLAKSIKKHGLINAIVFFSYTYTLTTYNLETIQYPKTAIPVNKNYLLLF